MGHPNILWGTQPRHGHPNTSWGPSHAMDTPHPVRTLYSVGTLHTLGAQPRHGTPLTPQGPPRGGPPPPELCPHAMLCDRDADATPWDPPTLTPASPGAARCPRAWGWGDSPAWGCRGAGGSAAAAGTGWGSAQGSQTALRGQRGCHPPACCWGLLSAPRHRGAPQRWLCPVAPHYWSQEGSGVVPMGAKGCWGPRGESHGHGGTLGGGTPGRWGMLRSRTDTRGSCGMQGWETPGWSPRALEDAGSQEWHPRELWDPEMAPGDSVTCERP